MMLTPPFEPQPKLHDIRSPAFLNNIERDLSRGVFLPLPPTFYINMKKR